MSLLPIRRQRVSQPGKAGRGNAPAAAMAPRLAGSLAAFILLLASTGCEKEAKSAGEPPKPPEVTIAQALERTVTDMDEFTGRMESIESVEVRARVRGYLDAVHFTDGQEVKAGMLLFEIDPRTFEAELKNVEGQKAQWMAKRDKAKADVTRYEGLVPTGAASAQDLDKAKAELGEAVAAIQSADAEIDRARLDLEFSRVTAPIDGQIGRALITKGNLVQSGSGEDALLTTIESVDPMYVYFSVNERAMLRYRERQRKSQPPAASEPSIAQLKIPVRLGLANDAGFPHQGTIDFADNKVDSRTGTIRVRATLDNSKRIFKPGLFSKVQIPASDPYPACLIAQTAVGTDQSQKFVLVVDDQNIVQRRFVRLGPIQDDGLQVVQEGLKPGEWIVVNGIQRARPGKPVTPQRAAMPTRQVGPHTPAREPASQPATDSRSDS